MSQDAQSRGWGPHGGLGPARLTRVEVPGIPLHLRNEVAPLFVALVAWLTDARRRSGAPPLSSSGGYNDRLIAGSSSWSNHAWGLAADFNAPANPRAHHAPTDMPPGTSTFAASLGMRWGGDYQEPTPRDPMHFEFMGTPGDAAARVTALGTTPATTPQQEDDMFSDADRSLLGALAYALIPEGGPNSQGETIKRLRDISTMSVAIQAQDAAGIAHAIPADLAQQVVDALAHKLAVV